MSVGQRLLDALFDDSDDDDRRSVVFGPHMSFFAQMEALSAEAASDDVFSPPMDALNSESAADAVLNHSSVDVLETHASPDVEASALDEDIIDLSDSADAASATAEANVVESDDDAEPPLKRRIIWADDVGAPLVTMLGPQQPASDVAVAAPSPSSSSPSSSAAPPRPTPSAASAAAAARAIVPVGNGRAPTVWDNFIDASRLFRPLPVCAAVWERFIDGVRERILDTLDVPVIRWQLQSPGEVGDPQTRIIKLVRQYMTYYDKFKIGHTWVPLRRLKRFHFCKHRVDKLVFVYISDNADHSAELEVDLIETFTGDARMLNFRKGGEMTHIGQSPFFVYVAFSFVDSDD